MIDSICNCMQIFHNAVVYTGDDFTDAFASFEEHTNGRIAPGRFADFVALGDDPFRATPEQIKDLPILQTWLEGA